MSKILILMRHGKAADPGDYADDFERPLQSRGRVEVYEATKNLKEEDIIPDLIIASPACRTASTARIAAYGFNMDPEEIVYYSPLYMGSKKDYIEALEQHKGKTILITGHNPAVGELAMHFSEDKLESFPTSAVAVFRFDDEKITLKSKAEMLHKDLRK